MKKGDHHPRPSDNEGADINVKNVGVWRNQTTSEGLYVASENAMKSDIH